MGATRAPGPSPGPLPGRRDLRVASVPGLTARALSSPQARSRAGASRLRSGHDLRGITSAVTERGPATSSQQPSCAFGPLLPLLPNQGEEAPEVPSPPTWAQEARQARLWRPGQPQGCGSKPGKLPQPARSAPGS